MRARVALVVVAVLASVACVSSREDRVERRAVKVLPAAAPLEPPAIRILFFGDFGAVTPQQGAVARAMLAENAAAPFDLAIHVGDNLYACGPDPRVRNAASCAFEADGNTVRPGQDIGADGRFARSFERRLEGLSRGGEPVPVYLAIGNHDVRVDGPCRRELRGPPATEQRVKACLEVQHQGPHWRMPGRHYVVERGPARLIVIDTLLLAGDYGGFRWEDELDFVRRASAGCGGERHCFVVGHYYADVAGDPRNRAAMVRQPEYVRRVRQLEDAMGDRISGWLAGHAHDLQHLRTARGHDEFIAASTSSTHPKPFAGPFAGGRSLYWSQRWGFGVLEVNAAGWEMRLVGRDRRSLYCCRAVGRGHCEPYACNPVTATPGPVRARRAPRA
ncbi:MULTISPECIES: metallophosphoesterase [Anaeromyxobacter]|uniref:metallophosphoesterase n=1 Tax=Anaeromyxobacter TaxID=161492 RepID=UPI001F565A42|nr:MULTISPECIES: metallophosphoesterase [unclassified Anaeromyxobacter]